MELKSACGNKKIAELLPWFISNSLSEAEMVKVEKHLAECPSCTEEMNRIQWISEGLYSMAGNNPSKHINSRLLTIYSESKNELKKEVIQRIGDHLSICLQCHEELDILNKVNQSLEDSETEPFVEGVMQKIREFFARPVLKPAYAYILILALLYPAWLGLFKRDSNRYLRITQPVNINQLFELNQYNSRGAGDQRKEIVLKKPSDFFILSFTLPVKDQENSVFQAAISTGQKDIVWQDEDLKFIDQYGTVVMVCPQQNFPEGKYILNVIEKQKQTKEVINKYMFNFEVITK